MSQLELVPSYDITIPGMTGNLGKLVKAPDKFFVFQPAVDATYSAFILDHISMALKKLNDPLLDPARF